MHIRLVRLSVKLESVNAFLKASGENVGKTVLEAGVVRFDLLQEQDDPTTFVVVEVYASDAARLAHFETEAFRVWREKTAPMLESFSSTQYVRPVESLKSLSA